MLVDADVCDLGADGPGAADVGEPFAQSVSQIQIAMKFISEAGGREGREEEGKEQRTTP